MKRQVLVVTNDGFGKRVETEEFRQQGRGGIGLICTKFKNVNQAGQPKRRQPGDEVMIATINGVVVRQRSMR